MRDWRQGVCRPPAQDTGLRLFYRSSIASLSQCVSICVWQLTVARKEYDVEVPVPRLSSVSPTRRSLVADTPTSFSFTGEVVQPRQDLLYSGVSGASGPYREETLDSVIWISYHFGHVSHGPRLSCPSEPVLRMLLFLL